METLSPIIRRKGFSNSVTHFSLNFNNPQPSERILFEIRPSDVDFVLGAFFNLTELYLVGSCTGVACGFLLDDSSMESIARGLPRIRHLALNERWDGECALTSCRATLKGLVFFGMYCSELLELTTHVNAYAVPIGILQGFDPDPNKRCPLEDLHVVDCGLTRSTSKRAAISFLLLQIFPSLKRLSYRHDSDWTEVEKNFKACRGLKTQW